MKQSWLIRKPRERMGIKNEYLRDEWIGCRGSFAANLWESGTASGPAREMKQSLEENFKRWGTTEAEAEVTPES